MSQYNHYVARINQRGGTVEKTRAEKQGAMGFMTFLKHSPSREQIAINGHLYHVSLQQERQDLFMANKIVLAALGTPIDVGTVFDWNESKWLVVVKEEPARKSYMRAIARECAYTLKWHDRNTNTVLSAPASVFKPMSSLTAERERMGSGLIYDIPLGMILLIAPKTEQTVGVLPGRRFVLEEGVWEVKAVDAISTKQLLYFVLNREMADLRRDDVVDEISNIPFNSSSTAGSAGVFDYSITGTGELIWGEEFVFSVTKKDRFSGSLVNTAQFTFELNNNLATIINTTNSTARIKAGNSKGECLLTVKEANATVLVHKIKISSLL